MADTRGMAAPPWLLPLLLLAVLVCVPVSAKPAAAALGPCDPLDPYKCYLPYPNNFWLRYDASSNSTLLQLTNATVPQPATRAKKIDPSAGGWDELDGFSPVMSIQCYWEDISLEASGVPRLWDIASSLDADSPTVLLDADEGTLVAHFTELDHRSDEDYPDGYERVFMMWPAHALENGHRYIVAMRGLVNTEGQDIAPSVAFTALRDNITTSDPNVELRRELFEDIFTRLEKIGVDRSSLQLAWDFTVATRETVQDRLLYIRDDAFSRIPAAGLSYNITEVDDNFSDLIYRRILGTFQAPLYLNSAEPGSYFVLGPNGMPEFQGWTPVPFEVLIPKSLVQDTATGDVMQYGHGLFGDKSEVEDGYLQNVSYVNQYVMIATDWWGLDQDDEITVALMLFTNVSDFRIVPDRSSQGMLNALLAMKLITGSLSKDAHFSFNNRQIINADSSKYYYGNSQGGIFGSIYMAVTTDVSRGTVGVPGGPYSLLLPRSADFAVLWDYLVKEFPDPTDRIYLLSFIQALWDRCDPGGYMNYIINPPPNTPEHQLLIQYSVGDAQVTYVGAYTLARSVGASMFQSNVVIGNETTFGFDFIPDSATTASPVAIGWQYSGVPEPPEMNVPANKSTDTHDRTRQQLTAQAMMVQFLTDGVVSNPCGGTCNGD